MTITPTTRLATLSTSDHRARRSFRPWYKWLLTALAFPPAGYIATLVAGRVDSVSAAVLGGLIAGAGIGTAQWALLRHRGVNVIWIPATAIGLGAGLAAGAALVSYRTDISSLVVMGAISGLAVGVAQGATLGTTKRLVLWSAATAALWAIGWTATTLGGIHVEEQFVVFGAYGCLTLAFLQSMIIGAFVPAKPVTS
jgi:hypothetical protein